MYYSTWRAREVSWVLGSLWKACGREKTQQKKILKEVDFLHFFTGYLDFFFKISWLLKISTSSMAEQATPKCSVQFVITMLDLHLFLPYFPIIYKSEKAL